MKETILLFNIPDKSVRIKIEMALFPLHVRLRYVQPEEYHQPLGVLLNVKEIEPVSGTYEGAPLPAPMLVFCGLEQQKLNLSLAALRKSKAGPLPYKAILTPTNQYWNAIECFNEIKKEHEMMNPGTSPSSS